MIDNLITVYLPDREIKFREPSFNDFKSICKLLVSADPQDIQDSLNFILDKLLLDNNTNLTIVEKFISILTIRNTILGNELTLTKDGKKMVINMGALLSKTYDDIPIKFDSFVFKSPINFLTNDVDKLIAECLVEAYGKDLSKLTIDQKLSLVNEIDAPLSVIYKKLLAEFTTRVIEITKDIRFSLHGEKHTLFFLKDILAEDLFSLLNFQYTCIRHLNFSGDDFNQYTYPECKIFLNHLVKERRTDETDGKDPNSE